VRVLLHNPLDLHTVCEGEEAVVEEGRKRDGMRTDEAMAGEDKVTERRKERRSGRAEGWGGTTGLGRDEHLTRETTRVKTPGPNP